MAGTRGKRPSTPPPVIDPVDPVDPVEPLRQRSRRIRVLEGGVEMVGSRLGSMGDQVEKLGQAAAKVPVVGAGVGAGVKTFGAGIRDIGERLHELPEVARSRRGAVLLRSILVAFVLVFAWVTAIVLIQGQSENRPDFRPLATHILQQIRDGQTDKIYDAASPRFQEVVHEEIFAENMRQLVQTMGRFEEISAINDTFLNHGPSGFIGRISVSVLFARGTCRGSVSFHYDNGHWKFLGLSLELPPEVVAVETSPERREARVTDKALLKKMRDGALRVLELSRDGQYATIWQEAYRLFQRTVTQAEFVKLEEERTRVLGKFIQIIDSYGKNSPNKNGGSMVVMIEYEHAVIQSSFGFTQVGDRWLLDQYKVVLPIPRPGDKAAATPAPAVAPAVSKPH